MKHSELRGSIELVPDIIHGRKAGVVVADDFRHCAHVVPPVGPGNGVQPFARRFRYSSRSLGSCGRASKWASRL
jgi:hypothetical protein